MDNLLRTVGWIACIVYSTIPSFWILIHPRTQYWRSRRHSPYRILVPLWIAMWVIIAFVTSPWRHVVLYSSHLSWIPAVLLFAAGFWLYTQSRKQFSAKHLGGIPEVMSRAEEQRLVTAGIRARVRHPVYLAHGCEMLAWSIGTGLMVSYALTGFAIVTGAVMIRMEDRELEQRFGEQYRRYRQQVPAIWPKIKSP